MKNFLNTLYLPVYGSILLSQLMNEAFFYCILPLRLFHIPKSERGDRILSDLNISIGSDKNRVRFDRFFMKDDGFR